MPDRGLALDLHVVGLGAWSDEQGALWGLKTSKHREHVGATSFMKSHWKDKIF